MDRRDTCRRRDRFRRVVMMMQPYGMHVTVHRWGGRSGCQRGRGSDIDDWRGRPGDALLRLLVLLVMSLRRSAQILWLCAQILRLGDVVHHDIDDFLCKRREKISFQTNEILFDVLRRSLRKS